MRATRYVFNSSSASLASILKSKANFILPPQLLSCSLVSRSLNQSTSSQRLQSVRFSTKAVEPSRKISKPRNRVYVWNIDWRSTRKDLKDHMSHCGEVVKVYRSGRSNGCAVVEYSTEEEAERAITELTNSEMLGRKIFVREDREVTEAISAVKILAKRTLIVENIPLYFNWQELKNLFKPVGHVLRVDIVSDFRLGLVRFRRSSDVSRAIDNAASIAVDNMIFRAVRKGEDIGSLLGTNSESRKLYVGSLDGSVTSQELKDHFHSVGNVISADVRTTEEEEGEILSKGYGFIEFNTVEDAERAVERLNGSLLKGQRIHVRIYREDS